MKKTENKSLTVRKDKLEEINRLMNELNIDGFTTFTNITYDFFIKYHDKIEGDKKIDKGGRGFELVSSEQRKVEWYKLPTKSTKYSAGYDFYLPETIMLEPGETKLVFSNAKAYMNEGEVLKLYIRSSIGVKKGIVLANGTGIIDKDFYNNPDNEGNIGIPLKNISGKIVTLMQGERIAQGIFEPFLESDNCNTEEERKGGFGSTDNL